MKNKFKSKWLKTLLLVFLVLFVTIELTETVDASSKSNKTTMQKENNLASLEIHYIDVGQGDATLIKNGTSAMLIDAGDNDKGTKVQLYLSKQGVKTLDYVIGTHADADHIGGMDVILYKFDCKTVMVSEKNKNTATYRDVVDTMKSKGYKNTKPVVGSTYKLGDAEFTIIAPNGTYSDTNNSSIGIILKHGKNKFLFTGDAETEAESDIVKNGVNIDADVYQVGHHGSNTASSKALLDAVTPTYAVISCGTDNSYGHPHAETLNNLRSMGVKVFRTDEQGSIVAASDGKEIKWNCAPSETWQAGENTKTTVKDNTNNKSASVAAPVVEAPVVEAPVVAAPVVETPIVATPSTGSVEVHITNTGKKYHMAGCESLSKSDIVTTLDDAKARGLGPCKKCNPPQ